MEENHDIFAGALIFLRKRRLERMGIHAELRAVKISREEPIQAPNLGELGGNYDQRN